MFPLRDTIPSRSVPVVTMTIIAVNALLFWIELGKGPLLEQFIETYGVVPARTVLALQEAPHLLQYWLVPLFSSQFLHGGWLHIIGNMWFLWIFGDNVEDRLGKLWFPFFYLTAGIVACFGQIITSPASQVPMVGASGAIAGVLGAYMVLFPHSRVVTFIPVFFIPYFVQVPAVFFLGIWFVQQLLAGTITLGAADANVGGVAWWAHAGGFAWGAFIALFFRASRRERVEVVDGDWWPGRRRRGQW